jgi:predicted kinase
MVKEPGKWKRINNDSLREALDFSVYSPENEKMIQSTRTFLIKTALSNGFNLLIDNVNANKRHFQDVCNIAKSLNLDITVMERAFYEELDVLLERDSQRIGTAKVGEDVVKKWFKDLGGKQFKHYKGKIEIFNKRTTSIDRIVDPMTQDENLPKAIICDVDGTLVKVGDRSPYDASISDLTDTPKDYVVETLKFYNEKGYKILFCSGRMEKDRAPTERMIEKCLPGIKYLLFMRTTDDVRKDAIIKEELFNACIKDKYNVFFVMDDRLAVCRMWFNMGLNLARIGDPDANF